MMDLELLEGNGISRPRDLSTSYLCLLRMQYIIGTPEALCAHEDPSATVPTPALAAVTASCHQSQPRVSCSMRGEEKQPFCHRSGCILPLQSSLLLRGALPSEIPLPACMPDSWRPSFLCRQPPCQGSEGTQEPSTQSTCTPWKAPQPWPWWLQASTAGSTAEDLCLPCLDSASCPCTLCFP